MHISILTILVTRGYFLSVLSRMDGGQTQDLHLTVLNMILNDTGSITHFITSFGSIGHSFHSTLCNIELIMLIDCNGEMEKG